MKALAIWTPTITGSDIKCPRRVSMSWRDNGTSHIASKKHLESIKLVYCFNPVRREIKLKISCRYICEIDRQFIPVNQIVMTIKFGCDINQGWCQCTNRMLECKKSNVKCILNILMWAGGLDILPLRKESLQLKSQNYQVCH